MDRHRPAKDVLRLIQLLSKHKASGLMVEEIAEAMETSTRTARRLLAAVKDIEPDLKSQLAADSQKKLWYLPSARTRMPAVSAEQLSSLTTIASFVRTQGHQDYANILQDLRDGLQAGLERAHLLRLDPDLEVLDASIEVTHRPGPKTSFDPIIRSQLLQAITEEKQVTFSYTDVRGIKTSQRRVSPYALVVGPRSYLVGYDEDAGAQRSFALSGIKVVEGCEQRATRNGFDVQDYVTKSFGAFHDGQFHQWMMRFKPSSLHELSTYQFHPSQRMTVLPSGEVEVSFYCESIREVAYECLRWDEHLVAIGPDPLRAIVQEICQNMQAACQEPL